MLLAPVDEEPATEAPSPLLVDQDLGVLLRAARFTTSYVRFVGEEPAPEKWWSPGGYSWGLGCCAVLCSWVCRNMVVSGDGGPGHGLVHLLLESAAEIWFASGSDVSGWSRLGLPCVRNVAGPVQLLRSAVVEAWRDKVSGDLCESEGFRSGHSSDHGGSL